MIQEQYFAIFDTRAPVRTTPLICLPHTDRTKNRPLADRSQIFLGGQRRGACRLSPRLHCISQHSVHSIVKDIYKHRPAWVYSFPFQRYACFLVNESSKRPLLPPSDWPARWAFSRFMSSSWACKRRKSPLAAVLEGLEMGLEYCESELCVSELLKLFCNRGS